MLNTASFRVFVFITITDEVGKNTKRLKKDKNDSKQRQS